jgi:hypothetical protein
MMVSKSARVYLAVAAAIMAPVVPAGLLGARSAGFYYRVRDRVHQTVG